MASGWLGLDWGNVPAWVGAIFTSASLSLAAVTYARNSAERAHERLDRDRAQAAKVSSWPVTSRRLLVRNGNEVAVLVGAVATRGERSAAAEQVAFGPGETRGLRLPAGFETAALELTIVDSYGRVWSRATDGALDRVLPTAPPRGGVISAGPARPSITSAGATPGGAIPAGPSPAVSLEWESRS